MSEVVPTFTIRNDGVPFETRENCLRCGLVMRLDSVLKVNDEVKQQDWSCSCGFLMKKILRSENDGGGVLGG